MLSRRAFHRQDRRLTETPMEDCPSWDAPTPQGELLRTLLKSKPLGKSYFVKRLEIEPDLTNRDLGFSEMRHVVR